MAGVLGQGDQLTPAELATEAQYAANKFGQDRVPVATIVARGKRLYTRKRIAIHTRFKGIFYRTSVTFTLTSASNTYTPTPLAMVAPILVERQIGTGATFQQYEPVRMMDKGFPDGCFGWAQIVVGGVKVITFSNAGQAAGNYRLTYLEEHAPADAAAMVLPDGYEDVLVAELAAWLRSCYDENANWQRDEAKALEDECDSMLRGWNGFHVLPGLTNG